MRLPNLEWAFVPPEKITDYLISESHPVGRHKAAFFRATGYSASLWEELAADLLQHAKSQEVKVVQKTQFGTRYAVEGIMPTPNGPRMIRSVWFIEHGEERPRLVTAYPLG